MYTGRRREGVAVRQDLLHLLEREDRLRALRLRRDLLGRGLEPWWGAAVGPYEGMGRAAEREDEAHDPLQLHVMVQSVIARGLSTQP